MTLHDVTTIVADVILLIDDVIQMWRQMNRVAIAATPAQISQLKQSCIKEYDKAKEAKDTERVENIAMKIIDKTLINNILS